jgi:hypothetical protein
MRGPASGGQWVTPEEYDAMLSSKLATPAAAAFDQGSFDAGGIPMPAMILLGLGLVGLLGVGGYYAYKKWGR